MKYTAAFGARSDTKPKWTFQMMGPAVGIIHHGHGKLDIIPVDGAKSPHVDPHLPGLSASQAKCSWHTAVKRMTIYYLCKRHGLYRK